MIFDDRDGKDSNGLPINQGFENFGNSVYTMFVTMTTAILPDVMVPSYESNRWFALFWLPFFLLAVCVFTQVILATVYNEYTDEVTEQQRQRHMRRKKGIRAAFEFLKGDLKREKGGKEQDVVHYSTFVELVEAIRPFKRTLVA